MTDHKPTRWAWAEIDLGAYEHNIAALQKMVAPSAVWAVVKADAYGHGAVPVSRAAVAAGVEGLCVAVTSEGTELRRAGIEAPILVLSEQPFDDIPDIVANRLTPTVYRTDYVDALAAEVVRRGIQPIGVHVKIDTGMHRVGSNPHEVPHLIERINGHGATLRLAGVYTHFATADEPSHPANVLQAQRFDGVIAAIAPLPDGVALHAANSAGAMSMPMQRRSFVRAGIATYGILPGDGVAEFCADLRPVLSLRARVSRVQRIAAGEGVSYGHRFVAQHDTTIATLPIGYADGVPRRLWSQGGAVLVGGRRRPIVGVVTMDQLMVDCGDGEVGVGDEAVLIGRQGNERITAEDWARALDTIGYEVTCGIGPRVPRVYTRSV